MKTESTPLTCESVGYPQYYFIATAIDLASVDHVTFATRTDYFVIDSARLATSS